MELPEGVGEVTRHYLPHWFGKVGRASRQLYPRPGLSGVAVTLAAFESWADTLSIVHATVVVALYATSGTTCA